MLQIQLDKLLISHNGGRYLVVNSRPGIDSWRFSHETVMQLFSQNQFVQFVDFSFMDPSVSLKSYARKIVRNFFEINNYEDKINVSFYQKNIKVLKIRFSRKLMFHLDFFSFSKIFSKNLKLSKEIEVPGHTWLSITSGTTHYSMDFKSRYNLCKVIRSYKWTQRILKELVPEKDIDALFTFNGRFPVDSSLVDWATKSGIYKLLFDGGSLAGDNRNRIQFFETSPHNPKEALVKIEEYWKFGDAKNREQLALQYLTDISQGKRSLGSTFEWVNNPQTEKIDVSNCVVFFASSDWEQGAISKWLPTTGFRNQFEVVDVLRDICQRLNLKLIIKLHPIRKNFKGRKSIISEESTWQKYSNPEYIQIITEDRGVRVSDLISNSLINIGFRTSVTAQSLFSGKPTAVCGPVPWVSVQDYRIFAPDKISLESVIQDALSKQCYQGDNYPLLSWAYYNAVCGSHMEFSQIINGKFRLIDKTL